MVHLVGFTIEITLPLSYFWVFCGSLAVCAHSGVSSRSKIQSNRTYFKSKIATQNTEQSLQTTACIQVVKIILGTAAVD
jgi:hypothetical protein